jgi:hypothetical protein
MLRMAHLAVYRVLSFLHFLVAVPLIAASTIFGVMMVPVIATGPIWLCILGTQLWHGPSPRVLTWVHITHLCSLLVAALLLVMGVFALSAAQRSAAHGGGLLGAWGYLPIAVGACLALLAVASLVLVGPRPTPDTAR